jgi:hypothetical protein
MTQEEFIEVLKKEGYSYEIEGDKIVVTDRRLGIDLTSINSIPADVEFRNLHHVRLCLLNTLPPGIEFNNTGRVTLESLTSLPHGAEFKNEGNVLLNSLTSISPGMEFRNKGDVYLESLIGGWFEDWKDNIRGVESKRLLNLMISKGMFI